MPASDVRFGSSFLDITKHEKSVLGEIMTDKLTGEVYIKRPQDGKLISFRQKSHTVYEAVQEFNIQYQSSIGFALFIKRPTLYDAYFVSLVATSVYDQLLGIAAIISLRVTLFSTPFSGA